MKELYYFSKSDVMIQVQFSNASQSLRYASHRHLSEEERMTIEKYLLKNVVSESHTEWGDTQLDYLGIDYKLINSLNQFNSVKPSESKEDAALNNPFKSFVNKDIEKSVNELITTSMTNYYFEKIGSTLLETRREIEAAAEKTKLAEYKQMLEELVDAYNQYSNRKVKIKDILPAELCV